MCRLVEYVHIIIGYCINNYVSQAVEDVYTLNLLLAYLLFIESWLCW